MNAHLRPSSESVRDENEADEVELQDVLDALDDADCRCILQAVTERSMTASELTDACGLSPTTTYRKLDLLTGVSLVEESTRVCSNGTHPSEYSCSFDEIVLGIADSGTLSVDVTRSRSTPERWSAAFGNR